jgi:agmatine/peptidylarginine deiminase
VRVRQAVGKDAVVVPALDEEDHAVIRDTVKQHLEELAKPKRSCIICGKDATHCVKGHPLDAYCRKCAKEQFKLLSYLQRL